MFAAIDPLWLMLFALVFVAVAMLTARRPAYGIAALIVSQPFAGAHYIFSTTVTLPKVVLFAAIVGLIGRGRLAALRERPVRDVLLALVAVAIVTALTIAVAADRGPAIRETLKWIGYAALFATVCVAYDADAEDTLLVRAWMFVTLAVACLALLQEVIGAPSGLALNGVVVPRIAGPLEGPNQLAGYLGVSLAVLCSWYRRERLSFAVIALAICALALTLSRGGIIAAAIGIAAIFFARARARGELALPVASGAALGAVGACVWIALTQLRGLLPTAPAPPYAGGVGYRPELWRAAIALWERHPWLGVGAGNFELDLQSVGLRGVRTHANSWPLQALAEGGIALLAATVALAVTLLRVLGKKLSEAHPWQIAAFAASLALIAHQLVDYLVYYPKVAESWWIVVALGTRAVKRRE